MRRSFISLVTVLLVLGCGCVWGQDNSNPTQESNPVTVQPGPIPAYVYPDTTPSLDFLNEPLENSSITLGISTGYSYYNYIYSSGPNTGRGLWTVTPRIHIQQFRPTLAWHIGYAGGYQKYVQGGGTTGYNNLFSQDASAGFVWQMAPHWQFLANDSFIYTANPFESFVTIPGAPAVNNPNPVSYLPLTQYTLNTGIATLTNQLTKTDTLSFSGTTNLRRTSNYNLVTSVPFYNLVSYGGLAAYSHKVSPRLSLGASYNYNSLDFGRGQQRSGIQTIAFTFDYLIRPNMSISGWVGPEYTSTKTSIFDPITGQQLVSYNNLWSSAEGANFSWQALRNSFRAEFSRRVMDGGGLIATAQVTSAGATYRRMITKKWDGLAGFTYLHNVSTTANRNYNNFYLSGSVHYKVTKSIGIIGAYAYQHIDESGFFLNSIGNRSDNRFSISADYTWNHPLGR